MTLDYFYGQSGELFSYFRIPKALINISTKKLWLEPPKNRLCGSNASPIHSTLKLL